VKPLTPPRTGGAAIILLVLGAASLHGQTAEERAPESAPARRDVRLVPGLRYGAPLGASAYAGLVLSRENATGREGPSIIAEAGQDGVRLSAGVSSVSLGGTFRGQLSFIRTWDDHGDVLANQSYVGPEVAVGLIAGVTVGHYWRISDGGGKARIFALGSFIGF
jgi:hypothetical protein